MKKVIVFLILCAVAYGCWYVFSNPEKSETETVAEAPQDTLQISVKNELKEVQADSVAVLEVESDTLGVQEL